MDDLCAVSEKLPEKKSYLCRKNLSAVDFSLCHLIRCQSKLAFIRCLSNFALVLLELAFGFLEWCSNQYMAFRGLALARSLFELGGGRVAIQYGLDGGRPWIGPRSMGPC